MQSQTRRDAVTVEIVYAIVPSMLLVVAAVVVAAVMAWGLDLRGPAWGAVGAAGFILVAAAALTRTVLVLLRARRTRL